MQAVLFDQGADDSTDVGRKSGMIERGCKSLRAATVAHIHAHCVPPRKPRLASGTDHVLRCAGAFESVDDHHRHGLVLESFRLPMTMAKHLDVRLDLEEALFGRRQGVAARQKIARQSLGMSATQEAARDEGLRL